MAAKSLTDDQHRELARLLHQAQEAVMATVACVDRAWYTDRALHCGGVVQEWLIDPLREAWEADRRMEAHPYPSVGYGGIPRRQRPPKIR